MRERYAPLLNNYWVPATDTLSLLPLKVKHFWAKDSQ